MFQHRMRAWGLSALLVGAFVASAAGGDAPTPEADAEQLARLEALLQSQQDRIDSLQQQLAGAQDPDQDAARVEAMKQQIREVLSEQEFRENLMPSMMQAGYDKGFFIKSSKWSVSKTGRNVPS